MDKYMKVWLAQVKHIKMQQQSLKHIKPQGRTCAIRIWKSPNWSPFAYQDGNEKHE